MFFFFFVEACETTFKRELAALRSDAYRALRVSHTLFFYYCNQNHECTSEITSPTASAQPHELSIGQRVKSLLCATIC